MATDVSQSLGIPLGRFIDVASFDATSKLAWKLLPDRGHRQLFSVGLNGLGVRARATDTLAQAFDLLFANDPDANHEERFQQDQELFDFVAIAASAVVVFSSYIVARAYDSVPLEAVQ